MRLFAYFLSVYFFVGSLLPATDFEEFSKVAGMIQHYHEHQQRSSNGISFFEFLRLHYDDAEHQKAENHNKLPLKHHSHHCIQYVEERTEILVSNPLVHNFIEKTNFFYSSSFSFGSTSAVFQPPRLA